MTTGRYYCSASREIVRGGREHADLKRVGSDASIAICVTDRQHSLSVGDVGYYNMVGHAHGRDVAQQERHTRKRIEEMRRQDIRNKRDRKMGRKGGDMPVRAGAIPSALLFSLKRQYGHDYLQKAEEVMKREGLWWGD